MSNLSVSKVHLHDEEALWTYYNNCGLSPALKFDDGGVLDYQKVTYSLGDMFVCSTASVSGWGFEKQQNTDVYFVSFTHKGESTWEMNKLGNVHASQQLCIVDSSRLVQGQFARGTCTDTVMIDAAALKKEVESAQGFACAERLEFLPLLPTNATVWPVLNSIIHCIRLGLDQGPTVQSPLAISYLKQALVSTLIESVPHNYTPTAELNPGLAMPRHLTRAIEYIHAYASTDIQISDLAEHACTSVRNLQLGFKLYKNSTPTQYLREVRLLALHSDLCNEDVRLSWQQLARNWGFLDMGLFARYYKKRFGETPFQAQYRIKGRLNAADD